MKDLLQHFDTKHKEAIAAIKHMIDVDAQEYPEYKQAATLCKFLFESEDMYSMVEDAEQFQGFYDNAQDFETLCHTIYHALTDDGDIAFVQVNSHCPVIAFKCRWDLKIDDFITDSEAAMYERFNAFKIKKGMTPLSELKMVTLDNVDAFIEAVKQYRIDYKIQSNKVKEFLTLQKRLKDRPQPDLSKVEFGTPHWPEE